MQRERLEKTAVVSLERLAPDREQRAREHLAGWADASLPDLLRVAHPCPPAHFAAASAEFGAVAGLTSRKLREQSFPVISQALVALRAGRGEPERVPSSADDSSRPVPEWMTEERQRRAATR